MSLLAKDIAHKGLHRFWSSGGTDKRGISPSWAANAAAILVHLYKAQCLDDLLGGYGIQKNMKALRGHTHRYSIELNANWRITFDCVDPATGTVTNVDLEDLHRPAGAKRRR
jgi:plasmid maintenance system killer protein